MAFEKQLVKEEVFKKPTPASKKNEPEVKDEGLVLPKREIEVISEKKKAYTFTLQPTARERLEKKAAEQGYRSSSEFLNDILLRL